MISSGSLQRIVCLLVVSLVIDSCGAPQLTSIPATTTLQGATHEPVIPTTTVMPTSTSLPPPKVTQITVDGQGDDWGGFRINGNDPAGDGRPGFLDLTTGYVIVNHGALYIMVNSADPTASFVQMDFTIKADSKKYLVSANPPSSKSGWVADITSRYSSIGPTQHSIFSFDQVLEVRIDLRDLGSPKTVKLETIVVWTGTCCQAPDWIELDRWKPSSTLVVDEFEPYWYIDSSDLEAIGRTLPDGIAGMKEFLPYSTMPLDLATRTANIIRFTQPANLPRGYFVERLFAPSLPVAFSIGLDGVGNMFVATGGAYPFLSIVDRNTGEVTRLFDLPSGIHWSGLIGNHNGEGVWAGIAGDIYFITPKGQKTLWLPFAQGTPMDVGPDSALYGFGSDGKLSRFTKQGRKILNDHVFQRTGEMSVAVDPGGVVYLTDSDIGALWRLTASGDLVPVVPSGLSAGDPIPLEIAPDGTLYSAGDRPYPVFTIDKETGKMTPLPGIDFSLGQHYLQFSIDPISGLLYFADNTNSAVVEIDTNGNRPRFVVEGGGNTKALTMGQDGNLYFADNSKIPIEPASIYMLQPTGNLQIVASLDSKVVGIDMGPDSLLYFATFDGYRHTSSVKSLDPISGNVVTVYEWAPDSATIRSLSVNPITGDVVVFDANSNRLLRVTPSGVLDSLPIRFDAKMFIVFLDHASDGMLYVLTHREEGLGANLKTVRAFYKSPDDVSLEKIADYNHQGCCQDEGFAVWTDGSIYAVGTAQTGAYNDRQFSLWHILPTGEISRLSANPYIDPISIVINSAGDIFFTNGEGLFRIWHAKE